MGYVKGIIEISITKIVSMYRISALVKIEKIPRVSMFTGSVIMLRIGFIVRNRSASDAPPINSVSRPPSIITPGIR